MALWGSGVRIPSAPPLDVQCCRPDKNVFLRFHGFHSRESFPDSRVGLPKSADAQPFVKCATKDWFANSVVATNDDAFARGIDGSVFKLRHYRIDMRQEGSYQMGRAWTVVQYPGSDMVSWVVIPVWDRHFPTLWLGSPHESPGFTSARVG